MIDYGNAPSWAKYVANDPDGSWYWYELKPEIIHGAWHPLDGKLKYVEELHRDWIDSATRIPRKDQVEARK